MVGLAYASTIAIVGLPVTVVGRLYAVWNWAGVMPAATAGVTIGVPALSVFTHAMHEAYFGEVDTEQTGLAYEVTFTCDPGFEANADVAGKTPSTASTPTHTMSRRDMVRSSLSETAAPNALLARIIGPTAVFSIRPSDPTWFPGWGRTNGRGPEGPLPRCCENEPGA